MNNTLLIWDADALPEALLGRVVLWRSFDDGVSPNLVSIPKLVEKNGEDLKRRYFEWIYSLGETIIQGRRLVDRLELRPGFSYWWMTLSVVKSNYSESINIVNAIKLMALEDWLLDQNFSHIKLVSANVALAKCIKAWCLKTNIIFELQSLPVKPVQAKKVSCGRHIYQSLPSKLKALSWFIYYLVQRWPLKGVGLQEWSQSKGSVTFVSYLFNLVPDALNVGKFKSPYWTDLPDALQRDDCKTNWLHVYVKDTLIPTASKAAKLIRQFNAAKESDQVHVTLDTFLSLRVIFGVLRDWGFVRRASVKFEDVTITQTEACFNIWPLFVDDWHRLFHGVEALSNLLNLNLYEEALSILSKQRVGVYLQENQDWEFALVHAWITAGHGDIIGAPHASVRFWDLCYFFDPRSYDRKNKNHLPMPNLVAVNGSAAMGSYLGGGYPASKLFEVEALRYLYLSEYNVMASKISRPTGAPVRVLVMGDYLVDNTRLQMRLLEKAAIMLRENASFIIKPHPNCLVNPADYPGLGMVVTMEPLSILLTKCDVAYTSSLTAAAVDAYCAGVPVISVLDPCKLNMSPLRGCLGAVFVSSPEELANALTLPIASPMQAGTPNIFHLDIKLPRWRDLLDAGKSSKIISSEIMCENRLLYSSTNVNHISCGQNTD